LGSFLLKKKRYINDHLRAGVFVLFRPACLLSYLSFALHI